MKPWTPMEPDPNAVQISPGTWLHWGMYLRGAPPKPDAHRFVKGGPGPDQCGLGFPGPQCRLAPDDPIHVPPLADRLPDRRNFYVETEWNGQHGEATNGYFDREGYIAAVNRALLGSDEEHATSKEGDRLMGFPR